MESLEALNRQLFLYLNANESTASWMLSLGKILAKDTLYLMPVLLAALWFYGGDARRRLALKAIVVTIISLGIGGLISLVYAHQRPFVLGIGHTYMLHKPDASFPSHHATIFAAIGFCLLAAETRIAGIVVLFLGLLAGWARIYLGVHFPLDIVGGFVLAYIVYLGVSYVWESARVKNILGVVCHVKNSKP